MSNNPSREEIFRLHGKQCFFCGVWLELRDQRVPAKHPRVTWDHLIPKALGSPKKATWNLVPACEECNTRKADRLPTVEELHRWQGAMMAHPNYWEYEDKLESLFICARNKVELAS